MRYFVQTVRFSPSFEKLGYQYIGNNQYVDTDGSLWESKELLDLGWGNEKGLIRLPLPDYDKLLLLAFQPIKEQKNVSDEQYNSWGALSILLEKYTLDFLKYIEERINDTNFVRKLLPIYPFIDRILYCDERKIHLLSPIDQDIARKWVLIKKLL